MTISKLVEGSKPDQILAAARELAIEDGELLTVLVSEADEPDLDAIVTALQPLGIRFFGGVFPSLIHDGLPLDSGTVLARLPSTIEPVVIGGLDKREVRVPEFPEVTASAASDYTAIVLVDGLTANTSLLLAELHARLGSHVHYIGGGAGTLDLVQRPCVFTNRGVFQDAAVIAFAAQRCRLGVRHGWARLTGPLVATRSEGNVLQELNWLPAFDVYRENVAPHTEEDLTPENIFTVTNAFPFGIYKEGREDVVRDPVSVGPDGELICVGDVPENVVLNILRGDHASLIAAAAQAGADCSREGPVDGRCGVVFDCISRRLFLGDDASQELASLASNMTSVCPGLPVWGVFTLGEISSHGDGFLEFLNKTIVGAILHD